MAELNAEAIETTAWPPVAGRSWEPLGMEDGLKNTRIDGQYY